MTWLLPRKPFLSLTPRRPYISPAVRGVAPMTVAIGFQCSDGVLLGADTEISYGQTGKSQESKIHILSEWGKGQGCACVYAGDVDFMKKVLPSLEGVARSKGGKLARRLEREWLSIHKKSRVRFKKGEEFPFIQMMFAIAARSGPKLYLARGDIFRPESEYEALGVGRDVARAFVGPFYPEGRKPTLLEASFLATGGLKQAKDYVQGCGKQSQFLYLSLLDCVLGGPFPPSGGDNLEKDFLYLWKELAPLVIAFSKPTQTHFEKVLKQFQRRLKVHQKRKCREEEKAQAEEERVTEEIRKEHG